MGIQGPCSVFSNFTKYGHILIQTHFQYFNSLVLEFLGYVAIVILLASTEEVLS